MSVLSNTYYAIKCLLANVLCTKQYISIQQYAHMITMLYVHSYIHK